MSFIAFCATAPRERRSFFAACVAEIFAFARLRKALTSSADQARIASFRFAIIIALLIKHTSYR